MLCIINKHQHNTAVVKNSINLSFKRLISSNNNSSAISESTNNSEVGAESTIINEKIITESKELDSDEKADKSFDKENTDIKLKNHSSTYTSKYKSFPSYKNVEKKDDVLSILYDSWKSEDIKVFGFDLFDYELSPLSYLSNEPLYKNKVVRDNNYEPTDFMAIDEDTLDKEHHLALTNAWSSFKKTKNSSKIPKFFKYKVGDLHKIFLLENANKIQAIINSQNLKKREKLGIEGSFSKLLTANTRLFNKERGVSLTGMGRFEGWDNTAKHIKPKDYIFKKPSSHIIEHEQITEQDEINDKKMIKQMAMSNILNAAPREYTTSKNADPLTVFQNFVSTTLNQKKNLQSRVKKIKGRKRYTLKDDQVDPKKK
ncbi:hypothetical protein DAHU10_007340 [Hanseniaspora uvarum]|nr:hypothetical protein DAHU10_007340 [Hanseniaspora uvarum]